MIRTADWQLTAEAFGGLLVERSTFREFEIGQLEYIFAKLMLKGYSSTSISAQLKKRLKSDFTPSKELLELLSSDGSKADTCHLAKDLSDALNELAEVKSLDHLAAPTEITIYPTMKCQLSCSFCFVREKLSKRDTDLPAEDWISLCRDLVDCGVRSISILGGEPTMYRDFRTLLIGLSELGVRVSFTTNGQHFSSAILDTIASLKTVMPIFSLHTLSNRSRLTMGKHYDPNRTVESMTRVRESGLPCRMNTVLTDQPLDELAELEALSRNLGIEKWSIAYPYSTPALLSISNFLDRTGEVVALARRNKSSTYVSPEGCMIFAAKDIDKASIGEVSLYQQWTYGCEAGQSILEIGPRGEMYPCASMMQTDKVIGNAFDTNWKQVWNHSPVLASLRQNKFPQSCLSCALSSFCKGGCPAYRHSQDDPHDRDSRCEISLPV